jgi:hypothetical protein
MRKKAEVRRLLKRLIPVICVWMAILMAVMCAFPVSARALETLATDEPLPDESAFVVDDEPEVETIPSLDSLPVPENVDTYDEVPLYLQTDYPNHMYGSGTIANNGCSVT